jgi:tetratricopeptide (TPR) repeat protein
MQQVILLLPALVCLQLAGGVEETMRQVDRQLVELRPAIGSYPPSVKPGPELESIRARYAKLKQQLDAAIQSNPTTTRLVLQRGRLQSMGHNLDVPGALDGATADLELVIRREPGNVAALVELGVLLVNSKAENAPRAETLFRKAQQLSGGELLEDAQRGLYFALYYQARTKAALEQAELLVKHWPKDAQYAKLREITKQVVERTSRPDPGD